MDRKLLTATLCAVLVVLLPVSAAVAQDPEPPGEEERADAQLADPTPQARTEDGAPLWVAPPSEPAAGPDQPQDPADVLATVNSRISYQGMLEEDGVPVTGDRDMTFRFYSDSGCAALVDTETLNNVPVNEGLFSVGLDVTPSDFNGQGLWLRVEVEGLTVVSCQEVYPAPYALSLRPGAIISDTNSRVQLNRYASALGLTAKYGMYAEAGGAYTFVYGVFGHADSGGLSSVGVYGLSETGGGVVGSSEAESGEVYGVLGLADSTSGTGVYGVASADSGQTYGVQGTAESNLGIGVYGLASAASGQTYGVYGRTDSASSQARGVFGEATSTGSGFTYGVRGESSSTNGRGVLGEAKAATGTTCGVRGESASSSGYGVYGWATATSGAAYGVFGNTDSADGAGVYAYGEEPGADLIVGGSAGRIHSDPTQAGSDIIIASNDYVAIQLNADASAEDSDFYVYDETGAAIFDVDDGGTTIVDVLQITGGADLAERFEIAGPEMVIPGMVVAIDPAHPGQLRVATSAYERTVAGCVSGANGVNPGLTIAQEGSVADGAFPVALSGRAYCWADAAYGPIEPGDLLTTSATAGHAMRVSDYGRAQGAVIGKAMSALTAGRGLVLVLVSLQ